MNLRLVLAGNPNCGKTALFNRLTGSRQKVGNYPGVTVEKKEGVWTPEEGKKVRVLDLPGTYSLGAKTPDEEIARDVLLGKIEADSAVIDVWVAVVDASLLVRNLGFVLELKALGKPMVLVLNMIDLARERGAEIDRNLLEKELGIPVVETVAIRGEGLENLYSKILEIEKRLKEDTSLKDVPVVPDAHHSTAWKEPSPQEVRARFLEVDRILAQALKQNPKPLLGSDRIDRWVLHPVYGTLILLFILTTLFQAVFSWATYPADLIELAVAQVGTGVERWLGEGDFTRLLVDGVIAGVGSVLVFLPQILLLFFFLLLLEDSGYMARAAFLMDRLMGKVGLHGRAFIPLLSSVACAIPGIMATRTIENRRDRLTTILVAPLMTCSARLPVYTLLIAAFIPNQKVLGWIGLQGLVMVLLYFGGVLAALGMAFLFKRTLFKGEKPTLLLELPTYKWPSVRNILFGLRDRAWLFLRRAGTVILSLSVVLWFAANYPKPPEGATGPAIDWSFAGKIGHAIEPLIAPLGFDWRIGVAFIPGFAAREVMVSALATVYAVESTPDTEVLGQLGRILASQWSVATALSLMVWYILSMQCLSTIAVVRRETNSWKWPAFMLFYMTVLAYLGSFFTYRLAVLIWGSAPAVTG